MRDSTTFTGPVIRGELKLLKPEIAASETQATLSLTPAALQAKAGLVNNLGPGDGLELIFAGTDAADESYVAHVYACVPFYATAPDPSDPPIQRALPDAWNLSLRAAITVTLGAMTIGDALADALAGVETGDLVADTLALVSTGTAPGVKLYSNVGDKSASAFIPAHGAPKMLIQFPSITADSAATGLVLGRIWQGDAQNGY